MRWTLGILGVLMLALTSASAQAPRRVALVIANAAYSSANVLTNPANDATIVSGALRQAGFQSVEIKPNLGATAFRAALRDFRAKANGADVALIYYAGHGIEANGKNWLIPTDAVLASDLDLTDEAVDLDRVLADVSGAKLRIVVLDACRDNPFGRSWRRGTRAVTRGLGGVDADDVLVIFAAAPGQVASDGPGLPNSPFAAALARRLPQPDLPVQVLGNVVRDDVLRATGNVQRPFVSASMTGELYYLVPRTSGAVSGAVQAPSPAPTADPALFELAVWNGALAANSAAAFEDYLRQYPQGRFRVQAQQNIARLRTPVSSAAVAVPAPQVTRPAPTTQLNIVGCWSLQMSWRGSEPPIRWCFDSNGVATTDRYNWRANWQLNGSTLTWRLPSHPSSPTGATYVARFNSRGEFDSGYATGIGVDSQKQHSFQMQR